MYHKLSNEYIIGEISNKLRNMPNYNNLHFCEYNMISGIQN